MLGLNKTEVTYVTSVVNASIQVAVRSQKIKLGEYKEKKVSPLHSTEVLFCLESGAWTDLLISHNIS
jgi:hypothetical protein